MTALMWFIVLWLSGVIYGFLIRWYDRNHRPNRWSRRHEGLISISDKTTEWVIAFWPLVAIGVMVFIVALWFLAIVEAVFYKATGRSDW